jgi:glutamate N-acetyltransferase / amino-acid N-acetyltransferase
LDLSLLPDAFRYAGVHCGVRAGRAEPDLVLVVSDRPAKAAGVFTQNRVVAAPVQLCRRLVPADDARGFVVCAGNANACTGELGLSNAEQMAAVAARALGHRAEQFLVCSTGVIGVQLPMANIERGIHEAAGKLSGDADAFQRAARAIWTTDTRSKISGRTWQDSSGSHRVLGFAKGAAMIAPDMATMLAFVLADSAVASSELQSLAARAADQTFNRIIVEGHTSTNDSLILLANGAGSPVSGAAAERFEQSVLEVCGELARAIVADAEGADHFVTIQVEGMRTEKEARRVARVIAESALVKTAIFGGDPNWGRIVSAAGYAGVDLEEKNMSLWLGDTLLYERGMPVPFNAQGASSYLKENREVLIRLKFDLGPAACTLWTSDLTYDYVRLNAEYTT